MSSEKKPVFCTIYKMKNEHLTKEPGLIPYGMQKYEGYDAFVATYIDGDYPNLKYLPGLRIEEVPKISGDWLKDSFTWLCKNVRRINVLNIYWGFPHFRKHTYIYKLLNPFGKIYLKFDGAYMPGPGPDLFHPRLQFRLLNKCVSSELKCYIDELSRRWGKKFMYVPNPLSPHEIRDFKDFSQRSNTIFTVGRLGTHQKATEILLESFAKISAQIPNWTLKLAGRFKENINIADDFYAKYPDLRERVIFTGEIRDREQLINLYRDAKIFAFPSRWETFGIALSEAMSHGCFPIVSDIPSSKELTGDFKFGLGSKVDDIDGLAQNLLYACTHEDEIEKLAREGRDSIIKLCDIKTICHTIAEGLK